MQVDDPNYGVGYRGDLSSVIAHKASQRAPGSGSSLLVISLFNLKHRSRAMRCLALHEMRNVPRSVKLGNDASEIKSKFDITDIRFQSPQLLYLNFGNHGTTVCHFPYKGFQFRASALCHGRPGRSRESRRIN